MRGFIFDFSSIRISKNEKNSTSLTLPLPGRIIFYINEEITFCHCAKGDFITKKRRHNGVYLYNQNSCSALPFFGFFADLALHDFELSKIWFRSEERRVGKEC